MPITTLAVSRGQRREWQECLLDEGISAMRVLLIEDNPADARLVREYLVEAGDGMWETVWAQRLAQGLELLAEDGAEAVLLDLGLPDSQGLPTFRQVEAHAPRLPIVVISGSADAELAAQAVREGAQDYLVKDQTDGHLLLRSLNYAVERKRAEAERERLLADERAARAEADTERRRTSFLAQASTLLGTSLSYQEILSYIGHLSVPQLADCLVVDMLRDDGWLHMAAVTHVDSHEEGLVRELRERLPIDPRSFYGLADALHSGRAELCANVKSIWQEAAAGDAEDLRLRELANSHASMCAPLLARGRVVGMLTFVASQSDRHYSQADLTLAEEFANRCAIALDNAHLYQQLQDTLAARQNFMHSVVHDLRNPLTALYGFAQYLRRLGRSAETVQSNAFEQAISHIESNAVTMSRMLSELLDVARLEVGEPLSLKRETVDLVGLVRGLMAERQHTTTRRHSLRFEPDAGELVGEWDDLRLHRVLENVLDNAIKYSPRGGEVLVRLRREAAWAVIEVTDEGVGIPSKDLARLFVRFYRAGSGDRPSGTGLGLWGAKAIVEQHGGTISVESREGAGTTVSVHLPLAGEPTGNG